LEKYGIAVFSGLYAVKRPYLSFISMQQVNNSCTNQPLFYNDRMVYGFMVKNSAVEEFYP
jgi:hypothetical protein